MKSTLKKILMGLIPIMVTAAAILLVVILVNNADLLFNL